MWRAVAASGYNYRSGGMIFSAPDALLRESKLWRGHAGPGSEEYPRQHLPGVLDHDLKSASGAANERSLRNPSYLKASPEK
ncbi:hypothetical protein RRG08_008839 [Elysia crispata]|uniref:Uncharacterized protein n=1 Tax=Elysia crispata TaxID=231223 RepID=A0AAE1A9J4_9GAST|nr:hypothetical protein RRG08_008839 [Elysia crispata]